MVYMAFVFHLSFLSMLLAVVGVFSRTTVQLLLMVVGMVFLQGLLLMSLGSSMMGSYLMIMYMGAMVMLFAFCILFINSKELMEGNSEMMSKVLCLLTALTAWEITSNWFSTTPFNPNMNSSLLSLSETNYMLSMGYLVFNELLIPLLLMMGILMLGLFITMKIIKNEC